MPITVLHVAKAAGVSRSTANMILTGRADKYAKGTRTRVLDAAKELAYRPNITAKSLRHKRSYLIGAFLSEINAPYMSQFLTGLQAAVTRQGCTPTLFVASCPASEREALSNLQDRRVDGIIVNPVPFADDNSTVLDIERLADVGTPIVEVFGRNFGSEIPSVITDAYLAGRDVTKQLLDQGCDRPMLVTPEHFDDLTPRTPDNWFALDFFRGYNDALSSAGIKPWHEFYEGQDMPAKAPHVARKILEDKKPRGIVTLSKSLTREFIHLTNMQPTLAPEIFVLGGMQEHLRHYPFCRSKAMIHLAIRTAAETAAEQLFALIEGKTARDVSLTPEIELAPPAPM